MTALSAIMFHVTRKLENSSVVYHKTKNPFGARICMNISFELLLYVHYEIIQQSLFVLRNYNSVT